MGNWGLNLGIIISIFSLLVGGITSFNRLQANAENTKEKVIKLEEKIEQVEKDSEIIEKNNNEIEKKVEVNKNQQDNIQKDIQQINTTTDKIEEKIDQMVKILLEQKENAARSQKK